MNESRRKAWPTVKVWIYRSGLVTALLALTMILTGPLRAGDDQSGQAQQSEKTADAAQSSDDPSQSPMSGFAWPQTTFLSPEGDYFQDDLAGGEWTEEQRAALATQIQTQFDTDTDGWGTLAVYALDADTGTVLVDIDASTSFVSASTYKLFVAYSMMRSVEEGAWTWDEELLYDMSLGECFEIMITESDNDCPEEWLVREGPEQVQSEIAALGLANTTVEWSNMTTTPEDLGRFLSAILASEGVSRDDRDLLLDAMTVQEFREGIPAGVSSGVVVADKVGFLDEYLHDAAIITDGDQSTVLVVMTANASWEAIANVATLVEGSTD